MPTGESNHFYKIFTEDLGLVGAVAQSVREERSKLRYVLQDFSWITLDLVRGKEIWRVTSAGEENALLKIKGDTFRFKLFARACSLVLRLVHGEGREDELFYDLARLASFLESRSVHARLLESFEAIIVLRILAHLGYLDSAKYEDFLYPIDWSQNLLETFENVRTAAIPDINEALNVSQL